MYTHTIINISEKTRNKRDNFLQSRQQRLRLRWKRIKLWFRLQISMVLWLCFLFFFCFIIDSIFYKLQQELPLWLFIPIWLGAIIAIITFNCYFYLIFIPLWTIRGFSRKLGVRDIEGWNYEVIIDSISKKVEAILKESDREEIKHTFEQFEEFSYLERGCLNQSYILLDIHERLRKSLFSQEDYKNHFINHLAKVRKKKHHHDLKLEIKNFWRENPPKHYFTMVEYFKDMGMTDHLDAIEIVIRDDFNFFLQYFKCINEYVRIGGNPEGFFGLQSLAKKNIIDIDKDIVQEPYLRFSSKVGIKEEVERINYLINLIQNVDISSQIGSYLNGKLNELHDVQSTKDRKHYKKLLKKIKNDITTIIYSKIVIMIPDGLNKIKIKQNLPDNEKMATLKHEMVPAINEKIFKLALLMSKKLNKFEKMILQRKRNKYRVPEKIFNR